MEVLGEPCRCETLSGIPKLNLTVTRAEKKKKRIVPSWNQRVGPFSFFGSALQVPGLKPPGDRAIYKAAGGQKEYGNSLCGVVFSNSVGLLLKEQSISRPA